MMVCIQPEVKTVVLHLSLTEQYIFLFGVFFFFSDDNSDDYDMDGDLEGKWRGSGISNSQCSLQYISV